MHNTKCIHLSYRQQCDESDAGDHWVLLFYRSEIFIDETIDVKDFFINCEDTLTKVRPYDYNRTIRVTQG